MDDMLEKHIRSSKHMLVNKMKQAVFLEKNMDGYVRMMRMQTSEGSNNSKEYKKKVTSTSRSTKGHLY